MRIGLYLAKLDEVPEGTSSVFTESEREYCLTRRDPRPHLAARYAAKRAACLALELSSENSLAEIEVMRERGQAPTLALHGEAKRAAHQNSKSHVSLTHTGDYAVALVVME